MTKLQQNQLRRTITSVLFLVLMAAAIMMSVYLVKRSQDIRNRAAGYGVTLTAQAPVAPTPVGQTTAVTVVMNTAGLHASAAQLRITFDPSKLQFVSITPSSQFPVELTPSAVSVGTTGQIDVTYGVLPTTPIIGTASPVATIRFTVLGDGTSDVGFASTTRVAATEKTDDVLSSTYPVTLFLGNATTQPSSSPTETPSSLPSQSPSSSPSPSPSSIPGASTSSYYFKVRVLGTTHSIGALNAKVSVRNMDEATPITHDIILSFAGDGYFQGIYNRTGNEPLLKDGFTIAIKGEKHVQRSFSNMPLSQTGVYADLTSKPLQPGDLPVQDGTADVNDINKVLAIFAKPIQDETDLNVADVNYDGVVNSADLGLILGTLSSKSDEN